MKFLLHCFFLMAVALVSGSAAAHEADDSFLSIVEEDAGLQVTWGVAISDLDFLIGLDIDLDGSITVRDINQKKAAIESAMLPGLKIEAGDEICRFGQPDLSVTSRAGEPYLSLVFSADCSRSAQGLTVTYDFLFDVDLSHRSVVRAELTSSEKIAIASADNRELTFVRQEAGAAFPVFFVSGVEHILEGYDHIVFLLVLILGLMIGSQLNKNNARPLLIEAAKILTAFTAAHAITITLAQFGIVQIDSWIVESAIALSIVVAVIDSFKPFLGARKWLIGFAFGLVHGLGFASALGSVGLDGIGLIWALVGFNLGIEAGQLLLAGLAFLSFWLLRGRPRFQHQFAVVGLGAALALGLFWFLDRTVGFDVLI